MTVPTASLFNLAALRRVLACLVGMALHTVCAASEPAGIFISEDGSGSIRLSDRAQAPGARLLVEDETRRPTPASNTPFTGSRGKRLGVDARQDKRLAEIVRTAASAHRVAPELLHAVIAAESGYTVRAVSPRGARGLMQLMPATAQDYGVTDIFDPQQNVNAGARHLRRLLDQFGQDTRLALAAYNAGAGAVVKHRNKVPPYSETAAYVPRVLQHFAQLQGVPAPLSAAIP